MFYDRLKELCKERGVSLTNVAKELGMSSGNLSKWKNGGVPRGKSLTALSEYFGVSADYLLGTDTLKEKSITILDDPELTLTADEKWFILKLRQLDKEGKAVVEGALVSEARRMETLKGETVSVG